MRNFVDYYIKYTERIKDINDAAVNAPEELVSQMERQYRKRIDEIGDFLRYSGKEGNKIVMLAGPSSSGKTTTASILCERLEWLGIRARRISLDEFFLGAKKTPKLPDGTPDLESIAALNIPQMKRCLLGLVNKGECMMPHFNFEKQAPDPEKIHVKLGRSDIVVVEGIHALNPIVTDCLPDDRLLKIYISVKQGISEGNTEILSAQDIRLCRRIVRDMLFRGASPEFTLDQWPKVLEGEEQFIQPYKRLANVTINSIHIYEPCVLSQIALPLLRRISEDSPSYDVAVRLMEKLELFEPLPTECVPNNSMMREFFGNGIYE